jgi:hypothetical protein
MSQLVLYRLLADAVLVVHFGFVFFVVGGLGVIWLGWALRWAWVRNFWFRLAHLLAMGLVLAETIGGMVCPLTTWENELRWLAGQGQSYAGSFVQHWLHRVMFYDVSRTAITLAYVAFFALLVASLWCVKPRWPRWRRGLTSLQDHSDDSPGHHHG